MSLLTDRLAQVELFHGLDAAARERLVAAGATLRFPARDVIVEQGKADRTLYLLLEGDATVEVNGAPSGGLEAGAYFGEIALIDHEPRSATVRAGEHGAKAFAISALALEGVLADRADVARALMIALARRVRRLEAAQPGPVIG